MSRVQRMLLLVAAAAVAACGAAGQPAAPSGGGSGAAGAAQDASAGPMPPESAAPSPLAVAATPLPGQSPGSALATASVDAGRGHITVAVVVAGPASYQAGCVSPLGVTLTDRAGQPVPTPSPAQAVRCNAITLETVPAGTAVELRTGVDLPAPGRYRVTVTVRGLGAAPPVEVTV